MVESDERVTIAENADGKRGAPNVLIYLYHTDIEGYYGRNGEHKHGRYRGWLLTDADGRYEVAQLPAGTAV